MAVVTLGQQYNVGEKPTAILVVESHVQRIVLATEETTVTQQVSHRLSNAEGHQTKRNNVVNN